MAGGNLIYDTNTLVQVVPNLKTSQNWLLDRFFPNIVESDSEFVSIDVDVGKRRMSPFVSPLVEGKLVEQRRTDPVARALHPGPPRRHQVLQRPVEGCLQRADGSMPVSDEEDGQGQAGAGPAAPRAPHAR